MRASPPAANPEAYVAALTGWRLELVTRLRAAARTSAALQEMIKWGHLVYLSNGPVLLIRTEPERVLFGFWRGQRLRDIEARLKPGGSYEMATLALHKGATIKPATARRLVRQAVALIATLGNPAVPRT